jgi:hypothetical protein
LGISKSLVGKAVRTSENVPEWTADDNESSAAAELAALREHHPGSSYEDHPDAANEYDPVPVLFTAPQPRDVYRVADQSHAVRKPITLPQFPFLPLPDRYSNPDRYNQEERYAA